MSIATTTIIFFSLISLSHFVSCNKKLMKSVCEETDAFEICIKCVESDPGADTDTKIGIASSVIKCVKGGGSNLESEMYIIASQLKDPYGKKVFEVCGKLYSTSNKSLASAILNLKVNKYDEAERALTWALIRQTSCRREILKSKKYELLGNIVYEMNIYEGLAQASSRIIERL